MTRRSGAAARGLAATLTLLVLVVGLPLALYRFGGSPLPRRLPSMHQITAGLLHRDTGTVFLAAVRDVSWGAWALFTAAVLAETMALLRGRRAPRLRIGGLQGFAAQLVTLAAMTFSNPVSSVLAAAPAAPVVLAASPGAHAGPASTGPASTLAPVVTLTALDQPAAPAAPAAPAVAGQNQAADGQGKNMAAFQAVVVRPGDCLWTIAEHYLGAGDRFPEIAELNSGHSMGHGEVFRDPAIIQPGWVLQLPGPPGPAAGRQPAPGHPVHHPGHPSRHHPLRHPHRGAGASPSGPASGALPPPYRTSSPGPGAHRKPVEVTTVASQQEVPPLAVFGAGMLAGGVVVSLARLRHRQRQNRRPGRRIPLPASAPVVQAEQRLRTAAPAVPPAPALRAALAGLGTGLTASGQQLADIAGIHLRASAMELLLAAPSSEPPPPPFTIPGGRQGMAWLLPLPAPEPPGPPGGRGDLLPGLLTAGAADGGGYLLADLEHLRVTVVDGPSQLAGRVLATAAAELATSELAGWYDLILVGYDELEVAGGRATACETLDEALDLLAAKAVTLQRRLRDGGAVDVRYRRITEPDDEDWSLTLLVSKVPPNEAQLAFLSDISAEPGGIAALVAADPDGGSAAAAPSVFALAADPDRPGGILARITPLQLQVRPQVLTSADYEAIISLFETAAATGDVAAGEPPYDGSAWSAAITPQSWPDWDEADDTDPGRGSSDWDPADAGIDADGAHPDGAYPDPFDPDPDAGLAELGWDPDVPAADPASPGWDPAVPGWDPAQDPDLAADWDPVPPRLPGPAPGAARPARLADRRPAGRAAQRGPRARPRRAARQGRAAQPQRARGRPGHRDFRRGRAGRRGSRRGTAGRQVGLPGGLDPASGGALAGDGPPGRAEGSGRPLSPVLASDGDRAGPARPGRPDAAGPAASRAGEGTGRVASPPAPDRASLRIGILGSFTVNGSAGALLPAQSQLILALALNSPVGLSNAQLGTLLGADPDHPKPSDSLRQLITRTRRQLGRAPDGREWVVHLGGGQYALHPEARFDWSEFSALAERGLAHRDRASLRDALALVRGQPFTGCYHWWLDLAFAETVRAQIVDVADLLASLDLAAGDPSASARAARAGLAGDVSAEQLWRALMRAEHATGNLSGVREAWTHCLTVISDIAPGGEPHPDTAALYRDLLSHPPARSAPLSP